MTLRIIVLSSTILLLAACTEKQAEAPAASERPEAAAEIAAEPAMLPRTASADGASVFFITPANGETVSNPVRIEFGINGMDVVKAGINQAHSGHHHLLSRYRAPRRR